MVTHIVERAVWLFHKTNQTCAQTEDLRKKPAIPR